MIKNSLYAHKKRYVKIYAFFVLSHMWAFTLSAKETAVVNSQNQEIRVPDTKDPSRKEPDSNEVDEQPEIEEVPSKSIASHAPLSQLMLLRNLPRVFLLINDQYVDKSRIDYGAMYASALTVLENNIPALVITLPTSLKDALERSKKAEELSSVDQKLTKPSGVKEVVIVDLGGVKKNFSLEPIKSLWSLLFKLRDVFNFVENEAKKQKLFASAKGQEPIDWEKIEYAIINGILATLDPHSNFLEPKYARDLTLTTKGEFGGIGIVISVDKGALVVISPIDGTPAAIAGVKAKDRIVKIDEDSAINMPLEDAVSRLRGAPGTEVRITVQRANVNKDIEFTLKRAIIKVESVSYALLNDTVGYVRIKAFQGNTAEDVKNAILSLKTQSNGRLLGFVLDLRDNPGGLLSQAVGVSDLFLEEGPIVSTKGSQEGQIEMASPGQIDSNLRIAVLVNGGSASASEIVAAALKYGGKNLGKEEINRAIVIGPSPTFGKGSVQMLFDFPSIDSPESKRLKDTIVEPAALKLTIAQYFAPQEKVIQTVGVTPDVVVAEVNANKKDELSLFQNSSMREIDLDAHIVSNKNRVEESLMKLDFLAPPVNEEENIDYGKANPQKLNADFAVRVGKEFIEVAKGASRQEMLKVAEIVRTNLESNEEKKILQALKKFDIDWSPGKSLTEVSNLSVEVAQNDGALAGDKLKLGLRVKNKGKETAYQVHAITHSKTPLFDQREFLFGKIAPGAEIERFIELEIPKDVVSRKDLMTVEFLDGKKQKITELNVPLTIKGIARPRFAHLAYIDDASLAKAQSLPPGEDLELVVWIKNVGDGKALEPTVNIKNESGSKVFLKSGRSQGAELLPNQERSVKFAFKLKELTDKVDFELQIFDGQFHDLWRDKITLDIKEKFRGKAIKKDMLLLSNTSLLERPAASARSIATLKEGARVTTLQQSNGYYLVELDGQLSGFVKTDALKDAPKLNTTEPNKATLYSINYEHSPVDISLKFGDNLGWTTKENGKISAEIKESGNLSDLLMYVNSKKVLYKALGFTKGKQDINFDAVLSPGVNIITVFAREDDTYGHRANMVVFYDEKNRTLSLPVEKPKKEHKPEEKKTSSTK
jgi:carboxyl-terminal processing protease